MKILFINRFYGGEQTPTGRMLHDLALILANRGHDVSVLCSSDTYSEANSSSNESHPKLQIKHLKTLGRNRLINWLLFWFQTLIRLPLMQWNRCVLMTDPPFLPLAAVPAAILHPDRRLYWWTMDLYPEALVAANLIRENGFTAWILRSFNEIGLARMAGVVALGPTQHKKLKQYNNWRNEESFSIVAPPWDLRPLAPIERSSNPLVSRFDWGNKKIALYAGNLGEGHLHIELASAARFLHEKGRLDWLLVFACRGKAVSELKHLVSGLPNVFLSDYLPPSESVALLSAAHVHLVTMKPGWEGVIVPSKLYGTLQTEAPVLFIGPATADTALAIESSGRGLCLDPGSPGKKIVEALDEMFKWRVHPLTPEPTHLAIADYLTLKKQS